MTTIIDHLAIGTRDLAAELTWPRGKRLKLVREDGLPLGARCAKSGSPARRQARSAPKTASTRTGWQGTSA